MQGGMRRGRAWRAHIKEEGVSSFSLRPGDGGHVDYLRVQVHETVRGGVDAFEARPQEGLQGRAVKALCEAVGGDAPPAGWPFNLQVFEDARADAIGRRCAC